MSTARPFRRLLLLPFALCLVGCLSDDDDAYQDPAARYQDEDLETFVAELLEGPYLYAEDNPRLDPADYDSAQDLLAARRQDEERDRWSYLTEVSTFDSHFQAGETVAWGFTAKQTATGHLRLAIVQPGSPADAAGLRRGDTLLAIDDLDLTPPIDATAYRAAIGPSQEGYRATFTWRDASGRERIDDLVKQVITIDPVPTARIVSLGSEDPIQVGYVAFHDFISPATTQLESVFATFAQAGIDELVVDLRYNGGGSLGVMHYAGSLMHTTGYPVAAAGITLAASQPNDPFFTLDFNQWQDWRDDSTYHFVDLEESVHLDRIFFLTTGSSASASEALINGLRPYHEVILIGDHTHGKPVGMTPFEHRDSGMLLVSLTFAIRNALGDGDYFAGLQADALRADDLDRALGDPTESMFAEALYYIENGRFSELVEPAALRRDPPQDLQAALGGLRALHGHL